MSAMLLADPPAAPLHALPHHTVESLEMYLPDEETLEAVPWLTLLNLDEPRRGHNCLSLWIRFWKRTIDIVGALVLIAITWPLMLWAAVMVKWTSRGPIIYSQERVGMNQRRSRSERRTATGVPAPHYDSQHPETAHERRRALAYGRPFTIHKFRTMIEAAEANGEQFAKKDDPRLTRIGGLLRRRRIDELPQLWNVLKGEMSLVGPRPERPGFVADFADQIPKFPRRLGMKPGVTGLAQVENGYSSDELEAHRRKVEYDLLYLQNCCVWNDLKILWRTVKVVLNGDGH